MERLKQTDLKIIFNSKYRLHSYFPKYGCFLSPKFRNKFVLIIGKRDISDNLSDYFLEDIRLSAKRSDQKKSPIDMWNYDDNFLLLIGKEINIYENIDIPQLREIIFLNSMETKAFNPTWCRAIFKLVINENLKNKKWLDISADWGDRSLGFDPNTDLKPRHDRMIEILGDFKKQKIVYEPFEKSKLNQNYYDVVFGSPFFDIEIYSDKGERSILVYPGFEN